MIDTLGFKARQAICGLFIFLCRHCEEAGVGYYADEAIPSSAPLRVRYCALADVGAVLISQNVSSLFKTTNSALNTLKEKTKAAKYFSTKHFSEKEFSEKNVLAKKFQKVISAKKFQKNIFAQKMFSKSFAKTCKNFFKAFFQKFISAAKSFYPAKKYDVSLSKRFFGQNIFAAANRNA